MQERKWISLSVTQNMSFTVQHYMQLDENNIENIPFIHSTTVPNHKEPTETNENTQNCYACEEIL